LGNKGVQNLCQALKMNTVRIIKSN